MGICTRSRRSVFSAVLGHAHSMAVQVWRRVDLTGDGSVLRGDRRQRDGGILRRGVLTDPVRVTQREVAGLTHTVAYNTTGKAADSVRPARRRRESQREKQDRSKALRTRQQKSSCTSSYSLRSLPADPTFYLQTLHQSRRQERDMRDGGEGALMGSSDPHYMQPRRSHSCEGLMHKWLYCSYMEADKEDTNPNRRAHTITIDCRPAPGPTYTWRSNIPLLAHRGPRRPHPAGRSASCHTRPAGRGAAGCAG